MKANAKPKQDQETLYWLHIKSIPAIEPSDNNLLHIVVKSSFKFIYRPEKLIHSAENSYSQLVFSHNNKQLIAKNPTGHYITLRNLRVNNIEIPSPGMIAPFEQAAWNTDQLHAASISWSAINDYGGVSSIVTRKLATE